MTFHKILTTLLLCVITLAAYSQAKLKIANKAFENLEYINAITLYNQVLEKNDVSEAKINLATCYLKISDSENAEYWFGQVVNLPEAEPIHYLYYGYMLQRNGKCDLAKTQFEKFVELNPDDQRGRHLLRACDYEKELMVKNAGIYEVTHMPFNTALDDFGPMWFEDGLVFASETAGWAVKREHTWTGNPFLELRFVDAKLENEETFEYSYGEPDDFAVALNSKFHDATPFFTEDESMIYFCRNNYISGKRRFDDERITRLKIYYAEKNGQSWGQLEGVPFNSDEYSVAHPTLTPDGNKLYFSSDMPGGFGGMDLYVSEKENGRWGPPINLGPRINTEGHEVFPYFAKSNKLYFSSDGHVGLGGLDVYSMEVKEGFNEFGEIINFGFPINTTEDDFGIILNEDETFGYFSSDRVGGSGDDDIYSFRKTAARVEVYVYDEKTNLPIEGASVVNDCAGNTMMTNEKGIAVFDVKLNECCNFDATKETYFPNQKQGCTSNISLNETVIVEIPLRKGLEFALKGQVVEVPGDLPLEGAEIVITPDIDSLDEQKTVFTDAEGKYFVELQPNLSYQVAASMEGFPNQNQVVTRATRGLTKSDTLVANFQFRKDGDIVGDPTNPRDTPTDPTDLTDPITYPTDPTDPITYPTDPTDLTDPVTYPTDPTDPVTYPTDPTNPTTWPTDNPSPLNTPSGYSEGVVETGETIIREAAQNEPIQLCCGEFEPGLSGTIDGTPTYLVHVYYDFDQSYIRDDAKPELEKMLALMQNNPEIIIEIGSHTDSRGSNSYNSRLSQRRAESVVRWLTKNGIDRSRLQAQGYGETINVNHCKNNIPCSEYEHQLNRRTEFRVVGLTDGTMFSQPRQDQSVVGGVCQGCPF